MVVNNRFVKNYNRNKKYIRGENLYEIFHNRFHRIESKRGSGFIRQPFMEDFKYEILNKTNYSIFFNFINRQKNIRDLESFLFDIFNKNVDNII